MTYCQDGLSLTRFLHFFLFYPSILFAVSFSPARPTLWPAYVSSNGTVSCVRSENWSAVSSQFASPWPCSSLLPSLAVLTNVLSVFSIPFPAFQTLPPANQIWPLVSLCPCRWWVYLPTNTLPVDVLPSFYQLKLARLTFVGVPQWRCVKSNKISSPFIEFLSWNRTKLTCK